MTKTVYKSFTLAIIFLLLGSGFVFSQSNWAKVGSGFHRQVNELYCDSITNKLYAGGTFVWANLDDTLEVVSMAQWDGATWDSIATRIEVIGPLTNICAPIYRFFRYKGDLYVNGAFGGPFSDTLPTSFAKLDTSNHIWKSIGCPLWNGLTQLGGIVDDTILITGYLDTACGLNKTCVLNFDGTNFSRFLPFDSFPFSNDITSNYVGFCFKFLGEYYLTGALYDTTTTTSYYLMKYNGSTWDSIPGFTCAASIKRILVYNNELYIAGYFRKITGAPGNSIVKYNGVSWDDLGGGLLQSWSYPSVGYPVAWDMKVHNGELYVVGDFSYAGGVPARDVAKWDGTKWCGLGGYFDQTLLTCTFYKDTLFVGGAFFAIDGDTVFNIARYIGGSSVDTCSLPVGITDPLINSNAVSLTPNPFSLNTKVSSEEIIESYIIFDLAGKEVVSEACNASQFNISLQNKGIFILSLRTSKGVLRKKIVNQ